MNMMMEINMVMKRNKNLLRAIILKFTSLHPRLFILMSFDDVIKILDSIQLFKWFSDNQMKAIKISTTSLSVKLNVFP